MYIKIMIPYKKKSLGDHVISVTFSYSHFSNFLAFRASETIIQNAQCP